MRELSHEHKEVKLSQEKIPTICIFGPPGAGKGLQASILKNFSSIFHLSTGDLFRAIPPDSEFARLQQEYLNQGQLVPDHLVLTILRSYIQGLVQTFKFNPKRQFLLLDGMPRTSKQASELLQYFDLQATVVLEIANEEVLIDRLSRRSQIEGRGDDGKEEIVRKRLKIYHEQTKSSLDTIEKHSPIFFVDGQQDCALVSAQILQALAKWIRP